MARISVVIPTKNAGSEFRERLNRIQSQRVADLELVIIDSGSTDGTVDIAEEMCDKVVVIPPGEFHHARTRNRGAEQATGDILVFTVQDAMPMNDEWLAELVSPIQDGTADVTYGNQTAYPSTKPPEKAFYEYFYPDTPVVLTEDDTNDTAEFYLNNIFISDVNSAVSRRVWNEFRFDDETQMSEDKDFAYRVASAGYIVRYCPDARVYHSHNYTIRSLFSRRFKDGRAFAEIAQGDHSAFVSKGLGYIQYEYLHLLRTGAIHWIPYSLVYDLTYFVSFIMGKNHTTIPDFLTQRI